jgi:hypothetical protein
MNLTPYQFVAPVISLVAIVYAWNLMFRQKKSLWEALLWTLFWGAVGTIALFPSLLSYLQWVTGIKSQVNAVLVTSIGVLFFMIFYLVMRLEELEQRQTRIVRKIALRDAGLINRKNGDDQKDI